MLDATVGCYCWKGQVTRSEEQSMYVDQLSEDIFEEPMLEPEKVFKSICTYSQKGKTNINWPYALSFSSRFFKNKTFSYAINLSIYSIFRPAVAFQHLERRHIVNAV